jgi:hypothetical protein
MVVRTTRKSRPLDQGIDRQLGIVDGAAPDKVLVGATGVADDIEGSPRAGAPLGEEGGSRSRNCMLPCHGVEPMARAELFCWSERSAFRRQGT